MALDPSISLDVGKGVAQPQDFLTAGLQAAQLGTAQAAATQRIQQAKDMAAINAAFTQAQGDPDKTQDLLNQSGSATAAAMWQQNVNQQRTQLAAQHEASLKAQEAGLGIVSQLASTLGPNSTPQQYAGAKMAMSGVMGPQGKPILDAAMPDNPDPSDIPGILTKIQGITQTQQQHVEMARQAIQDFSDGKTQSAVARSLAMINTGDPTQDLQQRGAMLQTLHERYGSTIDPILQSFVPLITQGAKPADILSAGGIKPTETVIPRGGALAVTPVGGGAPTIALQGPPDLTTPTGLAVDAADSTSPTQARSKAALMLAQGPEQARLAIERAQLGLAQQKEARESATSGAGTPETIAAWVTQLKDPQSGVTLTQVPSAMRSAVVSQLQPGELTKITAQDQAMMTLAQKTIPSIDRVEALAKQINDLGLMGTVGGNWRSLVSGQSAATDLAGLTPAQQQLVGQFVTEAGLITSGVARVHGGARGGGSPQMQAMLKPILEPNSSTLDTYIGHLEGARDFMKVYAAPVDRTGSATPPSSGSTPPPPSSGPISYGGHTFTPTGLANQFKSENGGTFIRKPDGTFLRVQ
jgi:hypothetical protein